MRFARPAWTVLFACCAVTALAAGPPETVEPSLIPAYRLLTPAVAAAGQPSAAALGQLKAMGFKTVVSLRTPQEGPADEGARVEAQGLRYVDVPVTPETFSLADVQAVRKVLDDPAAAPVLLHCASSNRVGGVWAVLQARRGRSVEQAEADGKAAGLHSATMIAAVRRVLGVRADSAGSAAPGSAVKP
jgi:uncharacterized protein (TIGR01244 family)